MIDLKTKYLGLELKNPLVASSSPLSEKVEKVRELEEAGVSAIVMYSLFEEQVIRESLELDHFLHRDRESFAEALTYLPEVGKYSMGPDAYVKRVQDLKDAVDIPIIGSLNGVSTGGWIQYAKKIADAGADALELNLYNLPTEVNLTSGELEDAYIQLVTDIKGEIDIPLAVKLSPFFTALPNFLQRLADAGAEGAVLFNRFYQPDFDLENLEITSNLTLSSSEDLRLPLRWIALMVGKIDLDFALTSGVHTAEDLIKAMMAGARVAMSTSALLKHGMGYPTRMLAEVQLWMEEHEYSSIQQMQGSMSQQKAGNQSGFERANYIQVLGSYR
ncbi:MAG: dihydroorotate dehydrogenase-like protein [Anaerolineales bacterium]|nr:dihydroorotate dehydrogenase-like protein [Anaerolineales bacterium]